MASVHNQLNPMTLLGLSRRHPFMASVHNQPNPMALLGSLISTSSRDASSRDLLCTSLPPVNTTPFNTRAAPSTTGSQPSLATSTTFDVTK
jgi:hypothetical protein